jgi:prevent-host-death family protein
MKTDDIQDAKKRLSELVTKAAQGEPFIISKAGEPLVMVSALDASATKSIRRIGFLTRELEVPKDFDSMGSREIIESFEG